MCDVKGWKYRGKNDDFLIEYIWLVFYYFPKNSLNITILFQGIYYIYSLFNFKKMHNFKSYQINCWIVFTFTISWNAQKVLKRTKLDKHAWNILKCNDYIFINSIFINIYFGEKKGYWIFFLWSFKTSKNPPIFQSMFFLRWTIDHNFLARLYCKILNG